MDILCQVGTDTCSGLLLRDVFYFIFGVQIFIYSLVNGTHLQSYVISHSNLGTLKDYIDDFIFLRITLKNFI